MNQGQTAGLLSLANLVHPHAPNWDELIDKGRFSVSFINPYSLRVCRLSRGYYENLLKMDLVFADGMLMAAAAGAVQGRQVGRYSFDGNSLAPSFFNQCARRCLKVVLVGGAQGVAERAGAIFKSQFDVDVAKSFSGYFSSDSTKWACIREIECLKPDVVIVGMGAPYQEQFLVDLRATGWAGFGVTCGGYFDQACENGAFYYPIWIEKYNLRAFYRLYKEPRRLAKRYFIDYADFYKEYFFHKIRFLVK